MPPTSRLPGCVFDHSHRPSRDTKTHPVQVDAAVAESLFRVLGAERQAASSTTDLCPGTQALTAEGACATFRSAIGSTCIARYGTVTSLRNQPDFSGKSMVLATKAARSVTAFMKITKPR